MAMTSTEKILARAAGLDEVHAGQLIMADLDLVLGNDITSPVAIEEFARFGLDRVFDKDKVALVPDHFAPNKDIKAATQCKCVRTFARRMDITNYFEVGEMGVEHALLPEKGLVTAGDVVIGADSHTCTYGALGAFSTGVGSTDMAAGMATGKAWFKVPSALKFNLTGSFRKYVSGKDLILHIIGMIGVDGALYRTMEFDGPGVASLTMDDRFTVCNMAIEAGGKNGIFPVDEKTLAYLKEAGAGEPRIFTSDPDAVYEKVYDIDLSTIESTVAFPHLPENTHVIGECGDVEIDQVVIGSCTNGRLSDLEQAADPSNAEGLQGRDEGGPVRHFPGCRMRHKHSDLRPLSWRLHGHPGRRREMRVHDQPQLRRPHGPCEERGLSCKSGSGRGKRGRGQDRGPRRSRVRGGER